VDWEIKSSIQQGENIPNGLIGINLSYMGNRVGAPERLLNNVNRNSNDDDIGYARYYVYPRSSEDLRKWIEDAYAARTSRTKFVCNSNEMMHYNSVCYIHKVIH